MKYTFKKIASILASALMVSSTIGLAAAAYPGPFVKDGNADVAVVYGSTAAASDLLAVTDITSSLQAELAKQTAKSGSSTSTSISGEASPLFTGSTKIYVNSTLNSVKSTLTKTELPTILKDGSFSGNVDATYTQTVTLGSNPIMTFAKAPTSSDDPDFGFALSTSATNPVYSYKTTFNKAVALNSVDSEGQDLTLLGQKFTIASATDNSSLILLKSAEKVSLSSDNPSTEVTVGGKKFTVELVSASDTAATIKVTDENGNSDSKEINENSSKKVQGLTVAVTNADETNLKLSASIIAGAEKYTFASGSSITKGDNDDVIDGTLVTFSTADMSSVTSIQVNVSAGNSDNDAIKNGASFVDPVFSTFKIDFASLSSPLNSSDREDIKVTNSGDDKLQVKLTDSRGNEKTVQYVKNTTGGLQLQGDNDGRNITVFERQVTFRNEYMVVGNEDEGRLLKVSSITNQTGSSYSNDKIRFQDVFSGETYEATLTSKGAGTVTIGGKVYDLVYADNQAAAGEDQRTVRLQYPDSGSGVAIIYPTIETSKGAKLAFYEPVNITLDNWDGTGADLSTLRFPDGDGYSDVAITLLGAAGNFTVGGTYIGSVTNSTTATIGRLTYNFTYAGPNQTQVLLVNPAGGNIADPAIVVFEEKDDPGNYNALIVTSEQGGSADDGIGVSDIIRTWLPVTTTGSVNLRDTLASNSKVTKEADLYGAVMTLDDGDSDQRIATISYPDEQVAALVYGAANSAEIEASTSGGSGTVKVLGSVAVKDSEAASVSTKNLIVVGGSCVNSVAAELLGGALCGADFEAKTGAGAGSFLIETFSRSSGKVATLVAGYNAGDTANAAKAFTTQTIDTSVAKKYKGTSATSVEAVVA